MTELLVKFFDQIDFSLINLFDITTTHVWAVWSLFVCLCAVINYVKNKILKVCLITTSGIMAITFVFTQYWGYRYFYKYQTVISPVAKIELEDPYNKEKIVYKVIETQNCFQKVTIERVVNAQGLIKKMEANEIVENGCEKIVAKVKCEAKNRKECVELIKANYQDIVENYDDRDVLVVGN